MTGNHHGIKGQYDNIIKENSEEYIDTSYDDNSVLSNSRNKIAELVSQISLKYKDNILTQKEGFITSKAASIGILQPRTDLLNNRRLSANPSDTITSKYSSLQKIDKLKKSNMQF